jgi:chitin disaccharide deacetylase
MKYLIVNGDDFGASPGITRGILEAHRGGILTSTSLMVDRPSSAEAARLARGLPRLSVGLHVDLPDGKGGALQRQLERFQELMGELPSHLDAHHNAHRDPRLLPVFLGLARQYQLPLREHSSARYLSQFYGRWDGESHPEQVSVESLVRLLEAEVREGCTELGCHPGYVDPDFPSDYSGEREEELRTLCDPRVRAAVQEQGIRLISFNDFPLIPTPLRRGEGFLFAPSPPGGEG